MISLRSLSILVIASIPEKANESSSEHVGHHGRSDLHSSPNANLGPKFSLGLCVNEIPATIGPRAGRMLL